MNNSPSCWSFDHSSASSILEHSLVMVALCRRVVEAVQRKDRDLPSQIQRAVSSVSLNLAEGFGLSRRSGLCMKRERACGSLSLGASLLRTRRRPSCNLWNRWVGGCLGW